jgi:hypothetical protein
MRKLLAAAGLTMLAAACSSAPQEDAPLAATPTMSFFVTSEANATGADLGGLEGADAICQTLASAAGHGNRTWRAYLSAEEGGLGGPVNARDRIGQGPWYNANGVMVAANVEQLHNASANNLNKETVLTETGAVLNGRGDEPNMHDILTGSFSDGTLFVEKDVRSATCSNWTEGGDTSAVFSRVGHHDRTGGGEDPTSWNSAHNTRGCSLATLRATGGDGRFYCFAAD